MVNGKIVINDPFNEMFGVLIEESGSNSHIVEVNFDKLANTNPPIQTEAPKSRRKKCRKGSNIGQTHRVVAKYRKDFQH